MKKNSYEKAAEKESLLGNITRDLETKGDLKNTAIETLKDVVIGVVAGGVAGSAIGRASLLIGAAVTGLGHYYKSRLASVFGIGMMAANGYQQTNEQMKGVEKEEGLEGMIEGAKDRVMNFKDTFKEKLFLDKVLKSKEEKKNDESTKGVGDVQYFTYPENKELGEGKELDLTALDKIEKQVADAGAAALQKQNSTGEISNEEVGDIDPSEKNF
ncbi:MAG: hypothetical protein HY063_10985 [Bacteroidetes bacterium]|nr:hypothetical protein [Bacteroidota bacterium]